MNTRTNEDGLLRIGWRRLSIAAMALIAFQGTASAAVPLSGDYFTHDPSRITKCDGKYYVYCTAPNVQMRQSTDMIHWSVGPSVLSGVPDWARKRVPLAKPGDDWVWAPDVIRVRGLYYLYYSFSTFGSKTSVIGLVTSPTLDPASPRYHWTDRGLVVASDASGDFNAIDPCPVFDARGKLWLAFGSWNRGGIQLVQLDAATGKPFAQLDAATGKPAAQTASRQYLLAGGQSTGPEGSFLWYSRPYYYLFENEGLCCQGVRSTYKIMMGRSRSITGPYLDKQGRDLARGGGTAFLGGRGDEIGPGQIGIAEIDGRTWYTFHYYNAKANGQPTFGLDTLRQDADGWPDVGYKPPVFRYDLPDGSYAIISKATGMALTVHNGDGADGVAIEQAPYTKSPAQRWKVSRADDGFSRITSLATGKVIDLWYCKTADGTKIDQFRWLDNPCQRWKIAKQVDGSFSIVSQGGGGAISVPPGDEAAGTGVQEFTYRGDAAQNWIFERL